MHYFFCKLIYIVCSPFMWVILLLLRVKALFPVWFMGFPYIAKVGGGTIKIGKNCRFISMKRGNLIGINHCCMLSTHSPNACLEIGNECGFSGITIGCFKSIKIGNKVRCGANSIITDSDWHSDDYRVGPPKPVVIHDNVWLGYGVTVLKGVEIGENSVVGAGSVVTSSIPADVIAAGNPCRVIKKFPSL